MPIRLFLCGDVMCGRGIDQILPHPGDPRLYEPYVQSAESYVEFAEAASGPIAKPVSFRYPWGDALDVLDEAKPAARIVNLETAVTTAVKPWPRKAIHYRMHPQNIPLLQVAGIDACVLANNHSFDWGREGLLETLDVLHRAQIRTAGAGRRAAEAIAPAAIDLPGGGRVLVFAFATESAGVPSGWAATRDGPGINIIDEFSPRATENVIELVHAVKRIGDIVVISMHWNSNWGYAISTVERDLAHSLIDCDAADIVYGHSSHHPRAIEIYRRKLILYGCGDFLNDYEGIRGHEHFRPDLVLMYLPVLDNLTGAVDELLLVPMQIRRMRVNRASDGDTQWLAARLTEEYRKLGTSLGCVADGRFCVRP